MVDEMRGVTAVLVHGAGHTSVVWREAQAALSHPSFAVDLPGRGARPADITTITVDEAADSIAADVDANVDGDVVLVGHSVAGTVLPAVTARLGPRVRHLVFVAGITAPEGELPVDVFLPGQADAIAARLAELRERYGEHTLESIDVKAASSIDSLNFCSQPMTWAGVPGSLPRTFIRCLRDPIQSRAVQNRFIVNCGASQVIDIDTGHTPALDAPVLLASLLDPIIETLRVAGTSASGTTGARLGSPCATRPGDPTRPQ
jgi:pimeloyl-ACP methyl ester carboxylesterase